jgi:hypothetical protein
VLSYSIRTLAVVVTIQRRFTSAPPQQFAGNSACKITCKFAGRFATAMKKRAENLANLANLAKLANLAETSRGTEKQCALGSLEG